MDTSTLDLFRQIYGGQPSSSGTAVSWDSALQVSVVLACVRVLANGVSQVPFRLYRQDGDRRALARSHPNYELVYRRPNKWQTSYEFRETLMLHLGLFWNAFVFVNRVGSDRRIVELIALEPNTVTVKRRPATSPTDVSIAYEIKAPNGSRREFPADAIWHLRGPSWNGWAGMDAIRLARNAIGLADALETSHATMHKNGARVGGLVSVDHKLSPEKYAELAEWLDKYEIGGERYQKPMILDGAAKFASMVQSGVDSQHLETRKFQIEEICREYGVMPIMVGYSDKAATYASAEQMFLAHVVHTLAPWYERIEQSADVHLLTEQERAEGHYHKFTPNALMRGASKDRAEYYKAALGDTQRPGWMTRNEVRGLDELNPVEDGDEFPPLVTDAPTDTPEGSQEP